MLDNRSKQAPRDSQMVDLRDEYDLRYWTAALNTPKVRLVAAVAKVGNCLAAVRKELEAAEEARSDALGAISRVPL